MPVTQCHLKIYVHTNVSSSIWKENHMVPSLSYRVDGGSSETHIPEQQPELRWLVKVHYCAATSHRNLIICDGSFWLLLSNSPACSKQAGTLLLWLTFHRLWLYTNDCWPLIFQDAWVVNFLSTALYHKWKNKPVGFYGPIAPPVRNAPELRSLHTAAQPVQSEYPAERRAAASVPMSESP